MEEVYLGARHKGITIYGINPVLEILRTSPGSVMQICYRRDSENPRLKEVLEKARSEGIKAVPAPDDFFSCYGRAAQGVVALLRGFALYSLCDLLAVKQEERAAVVVLDGVTDEQNFGAICRSAEFFGLRWVMRAKRRSAGIAAGAFKASAGAVARVKICNVPNIAQALDRLKQHGYWAYALEADGQYDLAGLRFSFPAVLVLGSEGKGVSRLVREKCDFLVRISGKGQVGSLNVSAAGAIAFFELSKQLNEMA